MSKPKNNPQKVYEVVKQIPAGQTLSYKQVAKLSGIKNPRFVGRILHQNPNPKTIPCHRVVRSDGKLASGYAFGGPEAQRKKLAKEGVIVLH